MNRENWGRDIDGIVTALKLVMPGDPNAIIAGGCLRDAFFGVPIKDYDVFVGPGFSIREIDEPRYLLAGEDKMDGYPEFFGRDLKEVWEIQPQGSLPVQVIVMAKDHTPSTLLETFDFGFTQVAMQNGECLRTSAFSDDAKNNTATYLLEADHPHRARSEERARRLAEKYPTRKFMFPMDTRPVPVPCEFAELLG